ncbi:CCDC64 [Lepeophtheirus salmonis]|uniref:CCDC64 n=1 Tax=Lepeophtheirus salmonis TaxID=72036 RepID=A0A7R8CHX1_LEPSM|nr:CCDC64 [Lepeophtheirus salmonis]CAF2827375.1 CCDC64 [Lepeophtheirus salmonis]
MNRISAMSPSSFSKSGIHHRSEDEMKRIFLDRLLASRNNGIVSSGKSLEDEDEEDEEDEEEESYGQRAVAQKDRDLEYSLRLEHLEQEKYRLKRQIEMMEDEYEQRMLELQSDLVNYKRSLEEVEGHHKSEEREKTELINQLKEQNQRLNMELQLSSQRQEDLENQLNSLKSQFHDKRLTMRDNVVYLESLKNEIELVTRRKDELEKQIAHLFRERESMSQTLEESTSKVLYMERQTREQHNLIRNSQRDINELTANNQNLMERLECLNRSYISSGGSSANMSIMNEIMEISSTESETLNKKSLLLKYKEHSSEDDDMTLNSSDVSQDDYHRQLREELISAYKQIKTLCGQIRESGHCYYSSTDSNYETGFLETAVAELNSLVIRDLLSHSQDESVEGSKKTNKEMEIEIHKVEELEEKTKRDIESLDLELKMKKQDINSLQNQLTLAELKLLSAEEETTNLKNDMSSVHLSKDQLIKQAWEVRDDAVKKKNEAEVSLAKERINLMQINSQLMEAIQQKIENISEARGMAK